MAAALVAVLLAAFGLRVFGLDWDGGAGLHPDERHIVNDVLIGRIHLDWPPDWDALLDPATSGLNPRSIDPETGSYDGRRFAYGALPLFVTDAVAEVLSRLTGSPWHGPDKVYLVGRTLSALLDTATVGVVYLLGARVFSRRVGLLGAAVAALLPMTIQLAHFFTTDSWLTCFVALCLYCAVRAAEGGGARWYAAAGLCFGLAMATKGSVFALAGVIGAAGAYDAWRRWTDGNAVAGGRTRLPAKLAAAAAAGAALAAFALFEPFALARPDVYLSSLQEQADIVRGAYDVPFTRQYVGTVPIAYQAEQLVRWGFGPVAGLLAAVGVGLLAWRLWRERTGGQWVLLAWAVGYGAVVAVPETKFLRYLAPLVPVLSVVAGLALDTIIQAVRRRAGTGLAVAAAALLLGGMAVWAAGFVSVYGHEHSRMTASRWIFANAPAGSVFSHEYWDDSLPYDLGPGLTRQDRQYRSVTIDLYADRPTQHDLLTLGGAFGSVPAAGDLSAAFRARDFAAGAAQIRELAPALAAAAPEIRDALGADLEAAADRISPPAYRLAAAMGEAALGLRFGDPAPEAALVRLGDAALAARQAEAGNAIYEALSAVDYVVLASDRVSDAVPRSPWRYPIQARYYRLLADGRLGFRLAAEFTRYPSLGPLTIADDGADESFINYDHPRVLVYRKERLVPRPVFDELMAPAAAQPVSPTRHAAEPSLLLDRPVGELPVVADARWSAAATGNSVVAVVAWVGLLALLQVAGWPLASLVLGRFADAGWGASRLIALLVAGYLVWLGASVRLVAFRAVWCAAALLAVAGLGWGARRWLRRAGVWRFGEGQRRTAVGAEAAFWLVFSVFVLFRYLNPDGWHPFWGGEKPMEFAHLNATLRSTHFPPYDPWYAGGYLNYYYYGLYLVAFCLKLSGIPSEIGFNLAQPTVIALLASGGYSVAATLGRDVARRWRVAVPAGAIGVLLLVGIGNLTPLRKLLQDGGGRVPDPFGYWTWDGRQAITYTITEFPYFTALYADLHAHVVALPMTVLAIALAYALAADPASLAAALTRGGARGARLVFVARLGLLALVLGGLSATNAWDVPVYAALAGAALLSAVLAVQGWGWRRRAAALLAVGAPLALVAVALFWPFQARYVPPFASLARVTAPTPFGEAASHLGGLVAVAVLGLVVALLPRRSFAVGARAWPPLVVLLVAGLLLGRGVFGAGDARLGAGLGAAVVAVVGVALALAAWQGVGRTAGRRAGAGAMAMRTAAVVGFGAAALVLAAGWVVAAGLLAVAVAAALVWATGETAGERFAGLLVAAAGCVGLGTEFLVVADDLAGTDWYRMNTIFKFYNQVWILLALAGAAWIAKMTADGGFGGAFSRLARPGAPLAIVQGGAWTPAVRDADASARADSAAAPRAEWSRVGLGVSVLVVAASLLYPLLATGPRLRQRFAPDLGSGTLNALDWMGYGTVPSLGGADGPGELTYAGDRAAIDWFNREVDGSPVVAEASIGPYRCNGSRFSIATGLPTIIGWERHQQQQRDPALLPDRVADVERLYRSPDPAEKLEILRRYDVAYVVVGDLERQGIVIDGNDCIQDPAPEGIAAFEGMVGTTLDVAFAEGGTTVYRVRPAGAA